MDNYIILKNLIIVLLATTATITAESRNEIQQSTSDQEFVKQVVPMPKAVVTLKDTDVIEEIMRFIEEGSKAFNLSDSDDIVAILGNTGAGKTTFTHFIAADNDLLTSVKADPDDDWSNLYVIEDEYDKISKPNETTISKTIVPELVIDENGISWYDCPGFSDTRNTTVEISSTFFINQIIEHAKRIKIIFVVNQDSVTPSGSRSDFDTLVKSAVELVQSIAKYKLSVGLIVTKVNAHPTDPSVTIPQYAVAKQAGKFIQDYKAGLTDDDENTRRIKEFLDLLLIQDETGNYTQINAFYRPDQLGPVSQIPLLIQNRIDNRKFTESNLNYTEIEENDFGYTLSKNAQKDVIDLAKLINTNVTKSTENIGDEIISFYEQNLIDFRTLIELKDLLNNASVAMDDLKNLNENVTIEDFVTKIKKFVTDEQVFISKTEIENLLSQQKYLEFLKRVSKEKLPINPNDWIAALQKCIDYISIEGNWYTFLVGFYEDLSEYNIQSNLQLYDVADLAYWGKTGGQRGIRINNNNFKQFLDLQTKYNTLLKNIEVTENKLTTINSVLNITLKHEISYQCDSDAMIVKREYLRLSEINLDYCNSSDIKHLQFYALNTFFTDSGLTFQGDDKEVAMLAYKHVVFMDTVFSLQGNDSTWIPPKQPEPDRQHTAGTPGIPGKAGQNGANFMSLSNTVLYGEHLTINAYAGNASPGQDGGKSFPQVADVSINNKKYTLYFRYNEDVWTIPEIVKMKENGLITDYSRKPWGDPVGYQVGGMHYYMNYKCCEPDGLAGAGGIGGHSGETKLITLEGSSLPKINVYDGKNGTNGTNVETCVPMVVNATSLTTYFDSWDAKIHIWIQEENHIPESEERCPRKPNIGYNSKDQEFPPEKQTFKPYEYIISYKTYLRENIDTGLRNYDLADFYESIENNTDVQSTYTVRAFAIELLGLERQFYELNKAIDFIPVYQGLLDRIEAFGQLNNETTTLEDRKILAVLYSSALTKVQGLKTNRYKSLVIDILTYFDSSIQTIQSFSDANRQKIINDQKEQYKGELDKKIEEAEYLIDTNITPVIDNTLDQFNVIVAGLVNDIIKMENETEHEIEKLKEARKKLQLNMGLRILSGVFKALGQMLSFIGPIGAAAGGAITAAASISDSLTVDPTIPSNNFDLPPGVKEALDLIGTDIAVATKQKMDALYNQIDKFNEFMQQPEANIVRESTKNSVADIKKELDENSDSPDRAKINDINQRLLDLMLDEQKYLSGDSKMENLKKDNEDDKGKAKDFFKSAGNSFKVIKASIDVYNQAKGDQQKIDELSKAIEQAEDHFEQLHAYENQIYETMVPMLNSAKDTILDLEKALDGRSLATLDVQKWQTQSKLRDMKKILAALTKGFSAENQFQNVFDKLNEAIAILIDVYERIQAYQEQQRMVVYMAALASSAFQQIEIQDPEMREFINTLELVINSNIILAQYSNAVQSFKQSVFPYASFYLDEYSLPDSLNLNASLPDLISIVVNQIGSLSNKIKELNATINPTDVDINSAYFNSEIQSMGPFYVWNIESYGEQINDLLSGEKVSLRADATQRSRWNAVKFNYVGLEFHLRDNTDENAKEELKKVLNNYMIKMNHSGISYYRCSNKFYLVSSLNQTLRFSYEQKDDWPASVNDVYSKLRNGNIVLSPYTLWTIQLESDNSDFEELKKYHDLVDIELYGYGQYVTNGANICNENLEKYYSFDGTSAEINNVDEKLLVVSSPGESNYFKLNYLVGNEYNKRHP